MNFLFWNVNRNKNINSIIKDLIIEYDCDIIGLAEYDDNITELIKLLTDDGHYLYSYEKLGCERIQILSRIKDNKVLYRYDSDKYTLYSLPHNKLNEINIVFVHLQSRYGQYDDRGREHEVREIRELLDSVEEERRHNHSVVVGDFNMPPFAEAMVASNGMHSLSSAQKALNGYRTCDKRRYTTFYNPMWNLLGDRVIPEGSYYYSTEPYLSYYWYIFDQVVIRPSIIDNFNFDKLEIIKDVSNYSLVTDLSIPNKNISDHLPIFFSIN